MKTTILGNPVEEHTEAYQREMFSDREISDNEKFEILHNAGIDEIKWDSALQGEYMQWVYFNIK